MDPRNFTIGVLSTTAAIFLVGLVIIVSRPDPVLASGMTASTGDFILTVGRDMSGDEELLYVIDGTTERMIVYRFDTNGKEIQLVQGIDLAQLRQQNSPTTKPQPRRP